MIQIKILDKNFNKIKESVKNNYFVGTHRTKKFSQTMTAMSKISFKEVENRYQTKKKVKFKMKQESVAKQEEMNYSNESVLFRAYHQQESLMTCVFLEDIVT